MLRAPPFYFQHWLFELLILRPSPGVAGFPGEISTAPGWKVPPGCKRWKQSTCTSNNNKKKCVACRAFRSFFSWTYPNISNKKAWFFSSISTQKCYWKSNKLDESVSLSIPTTVESENLTTFGELFAPANGACFTMCKKLPPQEYLQTKKKQNQQNMTMTYHDYRW